MSKLEMRLPDELYAKLKMAALRDNRTISGMARLLVLRGLEKDKEADGRTAA